MAEARPIPNGVSPKPEGAGQWCVYCSDKGYPIGIGKIVEIYVDRKKAMVFYSECREPVPLFMDRLRIFSVSREAMEKFSEMRNIPLQDVEKIFHITVPSEWKSDLAA